MISLTQRLQNLSPVQRRLLEERLRRKPGLAEPIAVVGMACRFPGAAHLDAFWQLLSGGVDATGEIPISRWDVDRFYDPTGETPGKMSTRWGGFLEEVDKFDALFFGVTPREAAKMDPQQRLLLEVAWEALEHGGLSADQIAGSLTGAYIGIGGTDYSKIPAQFENYYEHIDAHVGTGNALSIAANRLSYVLDLRGPSLAVDTACSSALVAVHLAVQSLRERECDAALAGGVNLILSPETTIAFSKARMLSPDGRCRPFDAGANGYVRGEGCGIVVLKRLADAVSAGDNILAVIRNSAINQDGRTSGITAPNAVSQQAVIRAALAKAGLTAQQVSYIEAHGTGTPLGDPIEVQALAEVFRRQRSSDPPCFVTSVKANVGHLETASGMAGLIKVILMMRHGQILPQLHLEQLNPNIELAGSRLEIPRQALDWDSGQGPRVAGVNSFGFGGTNAHVVLEEAAPAQRSPAWTQPADERPVHILALSAKNERALEQLAGRYADRLLEQPAVPLADWCHSAATTRSHFNHRLAVVADQTTRLAEALRGVAAGETPRGVKRAQVKGATRPKVAFLFTGQGSQYPGMGRQLYESQPTFRKTLQQCDEILSQWMDESLLTLLYRSPEPSSLLDETIYTQPALFALEYALATLWKSWGIHPDFVLGHSVGEYVAACVSGVFDLESGLQLIYDRARLMQQLPRGGRMAVIFADQATVAAALGQWQESVSIAASNGPDNTVISGADSAVQSIVQRLTEQGIKTQPLSVSHAFHSPLMEPILADFEQLARSITYNDPQIPLICNLTGQAAEPGQLGATYWRQHIRQTVRFADAMQALVELDPQALIEIGPGTSLLSMGRRCVSKLQLSWLPSLRKGQPDWQVLAGSVSDLYLLGVRLNWRGFDCDYPRQRVTLPAYPFDRSRHWFDAQAAAARTFSAARGPALHPLLGSRISSALDQRLFEVRLSSRAPAYLADHQVQGAPVVPGAAYVEQALASAEQMFGSGQHSIEQISIQHALFLPEEKSRVVQVVLGSEVAGQCELNVYSQPADEAESAAWTLHACAKIRRGETTPAVPPPAIDLAEVRRRTVDTKTADQFYDTMKQRGLAYGPSFRMLDDLRRSTSDALAQVHLPESIERQADQYHLHPVLLDAFFQTMACVIPLEQDGSYSPFTYMPTSVRSLRVFAPAEGPLFTYGIRTSEASHPSPELVEGNIYLVDGQGRVLVEAMGVRVRRLGRSALETTVTEDPSHWLYQLRWQPQPLAQQSGEVGHAMGNGRAKAGSWLILADGQGLAQRLAALLEQRGEQVTLVAHLPLTAATADDRSSAARAAISPLEATDYAAVLHRLVQESRVPPRGIVHLWSLDIAPVPADEQENEQAWLESARALGCGSTLHLVQQLAQLKLTQPPSLWLVTQQSQALEHASTATCRVEQSALWGFGRVAANEHPELNCRLVDLQADADRDQLAALLCAELMAGENESQIAYRDGGRQVARLVQTPELYERPAEQTELSVPRERPFRLELRAPGSFDALRFRSFQRQTPGPGQVEVEVRATGLNFSDVLKALGLYPGITDEIVPLGIEGSGVVTAVGEGVTRFQLGDAVMGVIPYCFGTHAVTAEYVLAAKPPQLDDAEASTIPITFLTAHYALSHLARLQPGERVLIHAGAGGVGLAAIQIAQHLGCEIFATAGSDDKRDFLRTLGVPHVLNSRTTEFADQILELTGRAGVDVVLNSLPGDAITKSLSILSGYGRFVEIGKTDIYQNRMIGLLPFQDNLAYFALDLDRMLRQRPATIRELFAEVMEYFSAGHYRPLPLTLFPAADTIGAFRYMAQRKNIGKVVVSFQDLPEPTQDDAPGETLVRADGSYLITGGTGALGLQVADWLVQRGARHLVLVARRVPGAAVAQRMVDLQAQGAQVETLQVDLGDAAALSAALHALRERLPPLRGIVHAAGVLDDGLLHDLNLQRLDRVMAPKVTGAWNLHAATRKDPLDFFAMFSSVAALLGSPGQANYAAGNAFLDGLAHYRRAQGLPATSINWGPWSGSGMAAQGGHAEQLRARGMHLLEPHAGLKTFQTLLEGRVAQAAVVDARWDKLVRWLPGPPPSLLNDLVQEHPGAEGRDGGQVDHALRQRLLEADAAARHEILSAYFRDELAAIMGIDPADLDAEQPLNSMGLDSLMALELKNKLESRLQISLPMARFLEGPSMDGLVACAAELLTAGTGAVQAGAASGPASAKGAYAAGWSPLVQLRPGQSAAPLFCIHPLGGDIRCYEVLAGKLPGERPVYALRARGSDGVLEPPASADEMLSEYVQAIRQVQPQGPYLLAGWSAGGIFAFQLAHALQQQQQAVGLLALIDTPLPSIYDSVDLNDDARFLCDLVNFTNQFSGSRMEVSYEQLQSLPPEERLAAAVQEAKRQRVVPAEVSVDHIRRIVEVGKAQVRWIMQYQPRPHQPELDVHLFRPSIKGVLETLSGQQLSDDLGWGAILGERLRLYTTRGDHFTTLDAEHAAGLAGQLQQLLEQVSAR